MSDQLHSAEKEPVRQKIIRSAGRLFSLHGFAAVSIDQIMAGAGLTRGGFYAYFNSKSELYAEAISLFIKRRRETMSAAPPTESTRHSSCSDIWRAIHRSTVTPRAR